MGLVVCTGANGFIGTHIVESFIKMTPQDLGLGQPSQPKNFGHAPLTGRGKEVLEIIGCDLLETAARKNAGRFLQSARYKFVGHKQLLTELRKGEKPLAVVHNGACSSTVETDPQVFSELNLDYSKELWNYCCENQIPFIYASSAGVYGDGALGFSDRKEDCGKFKPMSLYAKSKHDFDMWVLEQKNTPPLWAGLRYFNVYGPFESHKENQASMVYHWYQQVTRTGKTKLFKSTDSRYADGEQMRDFVHVKDIVAITLELLKRSLSNGIRVEGNGCFVNVGVGVPRTWKDMATQIFLAMNLPVNLEFVDMPASLARQYQNYTCAEHHGLKQMGLTHKFVSLEEGVQEYVLKYLMRGL